MLALKDIKKYISELEIVPDENVYIGKLDNKKEKSIGVYQRKTSGNPVMAIGGHDMSSYDVKPISLLVHWNKNPVETEEAAFKLFEKLKRESGVTIGGTQIKFIRLMVPEPQDVGTDDNGVYEYVIWLDFIYERTGE